MTGNLLWALSCLAWRGPSIIHTKAMKSRLEHCFVYLFRSLARRKATTGVGQLSRLLRLTTSQLVVSYIITTNTTVHLLISRLPDTSLDTSRYPFTGDVRPFIVLFSSSRDDEIDDGSCSRQCETTDHDHPLPRNQRMPCPGFRVLSNIHNHHLWHSRCHLIGAVT